MGLLDFTTIKPCLQENLFLGLESCCVDITVKVDKEFLDKYGIKEDDQIAAREEHKKLYDELMERNDLNYGAGGSAYNTIKIIQWMLQDHRKIVTFVGWIGKDKIAEIFKQDIDKYNIDAYLYETDEHPTCRAVSCISGHFRSIIAFNYFVQYFKAKFVDTKAIQNLIHKAKYIYMPSYYLFASEETVLELARHSSKNGKVFILNLSGEEVCKDGIEALLKLVPHTDILFGNKYEALALAEANNFNTTDLKTIVSKIQKLPKENKSRERIVVITQGPDDVIVCTKNEVTFFPANHVDADKIIDTTGAGDAFAGGFMSQLLLNKSMEECVRAGNYAASVVIQHIGCIVPEKPNFA